MIVTIHQPDFLPWLGFFDRWKQSDLYVVLDDVQFLRRGWHHRDKIKTPHGVKWLTVPVIKKNKYEQQIREVKVDKTQDWQQKHLNTLKAAYGKAPNYTEVMAGLEVIYHLNKDLLIDFNMDMLKHCAILLSIATPMVRSSEMGIMTKGGQRILDLVLSVGGSVYLTGVGSRDYLDEELFERAGIELRWQEFEHPAHPQLHGPFEPMLSVLDYLMMAERAISGTTEAVLGDPVAEPARINGQRV